MPPPAAPVLPRYSDVADRTAEDLLREYDGGDSFLLTSPQRAVLATGRYAEVPATGSAPVARRVADLLAAAGEHGHPRPVVVGAVPFDLGGPACLRIPAAVRWTGPRRATPSAATHSGRAPALRVQPVPSGQSYAERVRGAVSRIRSGAVDKVVLARALDLHLDSPPDAGALLRSLAAGDPAGYLFAAPLPGDAVLLGASPELVLRRSGPLVVSNPLAGSARRSPDPVEDRRRAAELLASGKDRHEHALVADAVAAALRPFCRSLDVPAEPSVVGTGAMWHLSTRISGHLDDPATTSLELAAALHPTPAVAGWPVRESLREIDATEGFDREFYAGLVGWCDAAGDGEWALALRCARLRGSSARVYAGAGIVADSRPAAELAETSAKLRTLLRALGVEHDL